MASKLIVQISFSAVVLLSLLARSSVAQICVETKGNPPSLPQVAPANFHVSLVSYTPPFNAQGHASISMDTNSSRFAVSIVEQKGNQVIPGKEFKVIFDKAAGQILIIDLLADQFNIENCQVQNVSSSADVFTSPVAKVTIDGVAKVIPTGNLFSGAGLKIDFEEDELINDGIPTKRYRSCNPSSVLDGQLLEVTWWIANSNQAPVRVKLGHQNPDGSGRKVETVYVANPLRALSEKEDATKLTFAAPRGVYCKGRVSAKQASTTFDRLSLGVDQYIYNMPGSQQPSIGPTSFRESYDRRGNLSMIEGDLAYSPQDKAKYGGGVLARINDFTRGISYVKNIRFGNCTYERIPDTDWATDPSPGGPRIKTPDEFFFPSLAELQYKGSGVYRSQAVDVYIGYQDNYLDFGDGKKLPYAIEYYLDIRAIYGGSGVPTYYSVPMAFYGVSTNKFNTLVEIFDFNTGVPRAYDHDISDCFAATGKRHLELVLRLDGLDPTYVKYIDEYRSEIMYSLVSSLSTALNISPLRIINPVVSVFMDPIVLVEITVSEKASVPGYTPALPETPLDDVATTMTSLISKGTLVINVLEGDLMFQIPVNDFASLDNRGSDCSQNKGMSTGAIAGLSIGMILLGAVLALGIAFAVMHFRKDTTGFGFKPFGEGGQSS